MLVGSGDLPTDSAFRGACAVEQASHFTREVRAVSVQSDIGRGVCSTNCLLLPASRLLVVRDRDR